MANYQLKRTNVLLGGQMKYDLVIQNNEIIDIHITPISDSVSYNKYVKENLTNYSHAENIKKFYQKNHSHFYEDFVDPKLTSIYPLPNEYRGPQTVTTYDAGYKLIPESRQIYNHQIEIFCPLWIEQISDISKLQFRIYGVNTQNQKEIFSSTVKFGDKLARYFNDFCNHLKLSNGWNWVFNISPYSCSVCGFDVQSGLCNEQTLPNFYSDIVYRERPLLEFNNMIIRELCKNHMICKQLFNFNLCFNLSDITNRFVWSELYPLIFNEKTNIKLNVEVVDDTGVAWDLKEIFTNHSFIDKQTTSRDKLKIEDNKVIVEEVPSGINALDYLQDDNYIHFIDKNKMNPTTCHWCIADNPTEHFNLYNGMSSITKKKDENIEIPYSNGAMADLNANRLSDSIYPYWCNAYELEVGNESDILSKIFDNKCDELFSIFSPDCWVKNIHYKVDEQKLLVDDGTIYKTYKVMMIKNNEGFKIDEEFEQRNGWYSNPFGDGSKTQLWHHVSNNHCVKIIIIIKTDEDITRSLYQNFVYDQTGAVIDNVYLSNLITILRYPQITNSYVRFDNGLYIVKAKSPATNSREVDYIKSQSTTVLLRNFGKIKPYFIGEGSRYKNERYEKLKLENMTNGNINYYFKYSNSNYEPKYPSINYFAFKKINNQ